MAKLIRTAKSGSDWTTNELLAYNIAIQPVPPPEFFTHGTTPSLDHLDAAIFSSPPGSDDPNLSDQVADYLAYLDLATGASQESSIDDFVAETLKLLRFNERNKVVSTRFIIPLEICGDSRVAQTDVCLLHRPTLVLLVVVEDKTTFNRVDPEAQVVAEAIASFQFNNRKREERGLPRLPEMTIPAITMVGTRPTFYLVPVTKELSDAVITAQYPENRTLVQKCITIATHERRASAGMEDTEYRRIALQRFLAFKPLARSYWDQILQGF